MSRRSCRHHAQPSNRFGPFVIASWRGCIHSHGTSAFWAELLCAAVSLKLRHTGITFEVVHYDAESSTLPSTIGIAPEQWHWILSLGLNERDLLEQCQGSFMLGWQCVNEHSDTAFIPFAPQTFSHQSLSHAQVYSYLQQQGVETATLSLNAACSQHSKFSHPGTELHPLAGLEYGVKLNRVLFQKYLQNVSRSVTQANGQPCQTIDIHLHLSSDLSGISNRIDPISNQADQELKLHCEAGRHADGGVSLRYDSQDNTCGFSYTANAIESAMSECIHAKVENISAEISIPRASLMVPDAGVGFIQQLSALLLHFFPTEKGWQSQTQVTLANRLFQLCDDTKTRATLFLATIDAELNETMYSELIEQFQFSGNVSQHHSLFESALLENILLSLEYIPHSTLIGDALVSEDAFQRKADAFILEVNEQIAHLPSHKNYLLTYLSER